LRVADRFAGPLASAPYFGRYERMAIPWRMAVGEVDGQLAVIALRENEGEWVSQTVIRVDVVNDRITRVVDYGHCPWVLPAFGSVVVETR
jgi:RNA polymerase sigma-70 factor, ECF subfamily